MHRSIKLLGFLLFITLFTYVQLKNCANAQDQLSLKWSPQQQQQSQSAAEPANKVSTETAKQEEIQKSENTQRPTGRNELRLLSATQVSQSQLRPGGIAYIRTAVRNPSESAAEGKLVATVNGFPDRQSIRRIRVRPSTTTFFEVPLHLPAQLPQDAVEVTMQLFVNYGGQEVLQDRDGNPTEYRLRLLPSLSNSMAALVLDQPPPDKLYWHWPPAKPAMSYEFAVATRIDSGNTRQTQNIDVSPLPLSMKSWEGIDLLVVSEPRAFDDRAFVQSFKRLIAEGRRAWIMLDLLPDQSVRDLLGAGQLCETVDEVEYTDFIIDLVEQRTPISEKDRRVQSRWPLRMKRVLQQGSRVTHTVDGWPAAIWMPVGYGEILITTLDASAWVEPRTMTVRDALRNSPFQVKLLAHQLASEISVPRTERPLTSDSVYPEQLVGNPVVPKSWVQTALYAFCLMLALAGIWRYWIGDLSQMGLISPIVAVAIGSGILLASTYVRQDIPEGVSKLQVISVTDDGKTALVEEHAVIYVSQNSNMSLASGLDGRVSVNENVRSGIQNFEAIGFQEWKVSNENWPQGIWRYRTKYVQPVSDMVAWGKLTSQGLELELPDGKSQLDDLVLSYTVGQPLLGKPSGTKSIFDGSQKAQGDKWIGDNVISDEQLRRLQVYQQFFSQTARSKKQGKMIYGWTKHWDESPEWEPKLEARGSALVGIPVRLLRPEVGEEIYLPAGLVNLRNDPKAIGTSVAFDDTLGRWADELTLGVQVNLQLVLPPKLQPFNATSIEWLLDIDAPLRDVRLSVRTESGWVPITSLESPSLPWSDTIRDPKILAAAKNGVLDIQLEVSERKDADSGLGSTVVAWKIRDLQANFRGSVLSAEPVDN